jgi:hypothetical protein
MEVEMGKTVNSVAGGVLSLVGAAFGLIGAIMMTVYAFLFVDIFFPMMDMPAEGYFIFTRITQSLQMIYLGWAVVLAVAAILAVIGGVYTLKRRRWGWSLTGAIASVVTFFPVGIAAVILVAQSKAEFEKAQS